MLWQCKKNIETGHKKAWFISKIETKNDSHYIIGIIIVINESGRILTVVFRLIFNFSLRENDNRKRLIYRVRFVVVILVYVIKCTRV